MSVIVESFEIFSVFEDSVTISLSVEPYDYRAGLVIWGVSGFGEAVAVIDVLLGQQTPFWKWLGICLSSGVSRRYIYFIHYDMTLR